MRHPPHAGKLALRISLVMLGTVFVVESAIMTALALTSGREPNRWLELVADSTILTLTMVPLLYWLVVRPLSVLAEERARLLAHLMEAQDAERKQLARDLHDEIGQTFTSLLVQLRVLEDAADLEAARQQARDLRTLCGQVYDQIRGLARGLYPTVLDDLGLAEGVRRLAEDFEAAHHVETSVEIVGNFDKRLERKVETTAYRVVQESLTNCAKHAQATSVDISLSRAPGLLTVTIADNGRGFDLDKAMHGPSSISLGLRNMQERALLLNGAYDIRSSPGKGTTVTLRLPLQD